jgi:hypothetical protein
LHTTLTAPGIEVDAVAVFGLIILPSFEPFIIYFYQNLFEHGNLETYCLMPHYFPTCVFRLVFCCINTNNNNRAFSTLLLSHLATPFTLVDPPLSGEKDLLSSHYYSRHHVHGHSPSL